jgi:PAS domain S-box-containing protein
LATDGAVEAVAGITRDITDRKQTELQIQQLNRDLARQADELQTILDTTPVGIAIADDPQCNFIRSNRFAQTMLGVSPDTNVSATGEQAESLPFRQFRDGQEIPGDQLPMQLATARKQEVRDAEIHVVRSDGATFDWWVNAVPLFDEQESVRGCVAAFMDVSELKQAEAKLHETLTLLNAISNYSLDIIFAKDREGRLLFVNPAISQYFGKSVAELIGKDEFFFMEDRAAAEAIRANDQRIIQSGVAEVLEEPIVVNGNLRTFLSTKAPLLDVHGNIMGIVGIGHDMTDRKQAEAALAERNQELDSFVHTVSHDLKAPLRAISNLSEWIEDDLEGQLPPDNQQQLQLLRARAKRMESMINSLLVYARVGRQEAPLETFNVAELLSEIIDSIDPPQSFSIEIERPMPTLTTKQVLLSQVFANLIGNAIKHHTSAEGHVNISAIEQRDFYEFRVRDDGPGIAPENHARIFEIFQALKIQDNDENTGVGLAIVKKIIEREKGTIRLESRVGDGTTFFFTWPKHHS